MKQTFTFNVSERYFGDSFFDEIKNHLVNEELLRKLLALVNTSSGITCKDRIQHRRFFDVVQAVRKEKASLNIGQRKGYKVIEFIY